MSSIGRLAEEAVAEEYKKKGFRILARNWTNNRSELDVIAQHKKTKQIHFIEVKYRRTDQQGGGAAAVNHQKQQQLIRGALWWLQETDNFSFEWQIDVADVTQGEQGDFKIKLFKNAVTE